jgi:hypothetical protein
LLLVLLNPLPAITLVIFFRLSVEGWLSPFLAFWIAETLPRSK